MASPSTAQIESLSKDIIALSQSASKDDTARQQMLGVMRQAMGILELPHETVWRMIMHPMAHTAVMTLVKMGVITEIAKSDSPINAESLSKSTGGDKVLIVRLLRPAVALGFVKQTDVDEYAATPITKAFLDPALRGGFQFMFAGPARSAAQMPSYLESTGYKNPTTLPGAFQYAFQSDATLFDWLNANPAMMGNFNVFMSGQRQHRKQWFDFCPVEEILFAGFRQGSGEEEEEAAAALIVDIGGGEGHDVQEFCRRFPEAPRGRKVLQDLPPTIENIKEGQLIGEVERVKYDFFTPQPIKGARAYYFRSVLHDWSDEECIAILKNQVSAMTPGYSKVLLSEFILPDKDVPMYPSLLDLNMMTALLGMERTETQWINLLDAAGLKVVKMWKAETPETEGLIEAMLKD